MPQGLLIPVCLVFALLVVFPRARRQMAPPLSLNTATPVQLHGDCSCAAAAAAPSASLTGFVRQRQQPGSTRLGSAQLGSQLYTFLAKRV